LDLNDFHANVSPVFSYGYLGGFRPEPMLPSQVYRFNPSTGQVRMIADQFVHPNGIAFTPDGKTAFM
jgi:gluconolactonase